jgi:excisionase family DNA binding protein
VTTPYLTVEAVAERLHLSPAYVRHLCRRGAIPHLRRPGGRRFLFLWPELEAWLAGAPVTVEELPRGGRRARPQGVRA